MKQKIAQNPIVIQQLHVAPTSTSLRLEMPLSDSPSNFLCN